MTFPHGGAAQVFRDGSPTKHNPVKSEIRALGTNVETRVEALEASSTGTARYTRDTLADLNAIVGAGSGDTAYVLNDGTNTGTWEHNGSIWVRVADLPPGIEDGSTALAAHVAEANPHGSTTDDIPEGATNLYVTAADKTTIGQVAGKADQTDLDSHTSAGNNPHNVTPAQIGVSPGADVTDRASVGAAINAMNMTDTLAALDKIPTHNAALGAPRTIEYADLSAQLAAEGDARFAQRANDLDDLADAATARTNLGLGNVNNTSDADKPVSTAQQSALDAKADQTALDTETGRVDWLRRSVTPWSATVVPYIELKTVGGTRKARIPPLRVEGENLTAVISVNTASQADFVIPGDGTRRYVYLDHVDSTLKSQDATIARDSATITVIAFLTQDGCTPYHGLRAEDVDLWDAKADAADLELAKINALLNVTGGGTAYAATGPDSANTTGVVSLIIPNVDCDDNPTLTVNSDGPHPIVGAPGSVLKGRLRASVPVMMRRLSTSWQLLDSASMNAVWLRSVGGSAAAYTADSGNRPVVSQGTIIGFSPHLDNDANATIDIDSMGPISLRDSDFQKLPAGAIRANGYYVGIYTLGAVALGLPFDRLADLQAQIDATNAEREWVAYNQARLDAMRHSTLVGGGRKHERLYLTGDNWPNGYCPSLGDEHHIISVGAGRYLNIVNMYPGPTKPLVLYASGECKVVTETKIYTVSSGAFVRFWRHGNGGTDYVFDPIGGTVTLELDQDDNPPAADLSFIGSGQSHSVRDFEGAMLAGFQDARRELSNDMPLIYPISGAEGSSGMTEVSGPVTLADPLGRGWWSTGGAAGPMLTNTWEVALNAAIARGQPAPAFAWHSFGQNDAGSMGEVGMSTAEYLTYYGDLFDYMRVAVGDSNLPIFISPLGAYDNDASPTARQINAVRYTELKMIRDHADVYLGPWFHDLTSGPYDNHPDEAAQAYRGWRMGALYGNAVLSETNGTGPKVTSLVKTSGTEWIIHIDNNEAGIPFRVPAWMDFIGFYAPGEDQLLVDPAVPISQVWVKNASTMELHLTLDRDVGDGELMWPVGAMQQVRMGRFPINTVYDHWGHFWTMNPVLTGAF